MSLNASLLFPENYPVRVNFKSSIFYLSSCTTICDFYFVLFQYEILFMYLFILKIQIFFFKVLLQTCKLMYRALQLIQ